MTKLPTGAKFNKLWNRRLGIVHVWVQEKSVICIFWTIVQFVFLPECCDYVGNDRHETIALAESLNGDTVQFYQRLAKENNVWLSLGGIHEIITDCVSMARLIYNCTYHLSCFALQDNVKTDKIHNSHVIIDNAGSLVAVYRKLHLFDVETSEFRFQESRVVNGGNYIVSPVQNTPLHGSLGLLIVSLIIFSRFNNIFSHSQVVRTTILCISWFIHIQNNNESHLPSAYFEFLLIMPIDGRH